MIPPASGTGICASKAAKVIRFARYGCANRPFYHIVVSHSEFEQKGPVIEQLGAYDPLPNQHNEKLISLNVERICYWLGMGASTSRPVAQLLGLSGLLPIHPTSYIAAWRARDAQATATTTGQEGGGENNATASTN